MSKTSYSTLGGRKFGYYVPDSYDPIKPTPVLLMFHGFGGDSSTGSGGSAERNYYGWQDTAEKNGFITIFPEAQGYFKAWNLASRGRSSDLGYIQNLLEWADENYNVSESQIFTTGHSWGAYFSYYVAVNLSEKIAAFGAHSGGLSGKSWYGGTPDVPEISADFTALNGIILHAKDDGIVPYSNSQKLYDNLLANGHNVYQDGVGKDGIIEVNGWGPQNHRWRLRNNQEQWDFFISVAPNPPIIGGPGDDVYEGGSGIDTIKYTSATDDITVDLSQGTATSTNGGDKAGIGSDSLSNIENVIGGNFDDQLVGDAANNTFTGGEGNDVIDGGKGADTLDGGRGNDLLDGGADIDTAIFKGNLDEYQVSRNSKTKHLVIQDNIRSRDGTDNVDNIENFSFNINEVSYFDLITVAADEFAEYGSVSVNHTWQDVELSLDYINPVVITSDPTFKGSDPAVVRLKNIDSDSFQIKLQEPKYKDGRHLSETISYVVMEEGTWELSDGTTIEAGVLNTNKLSTKGRETVALDDAFGSDASVAVFTQTQTFNGDDWVTTRTDNITGESFQLMMQEEENLNSGRHITESIGFFAIEQGTASDGDTIIEGGVTADQFMHLSKSHSFATEFDSAPTLLTKLDSFDGTDTANSRIQSVDAGGFTAMVVEEQSLDSEMKHTTETLSYLALDGDSGTLSGIAVI